jgi:phospholipid-binding lipoprotein MlaA
MNQSLVRILNGLVSLALIQGSLASAAGAGTNAAAASSASEGPVLVKSTGSIDIYEARDRYIVKVLDPYADINRVISDFNAEVYDVVATPASYYTNSPYMIPIRWPLKAAYNLMSNVGELTVGTVSNVITGEFADAGRNVGRSLTNFATSGGLYDVATTLSEAPVTDAKALEQMGPLDTLNNAIRSDVASLHKPKLSSFDDVFRSWGFGCGVYLVFPLLGPGTSRELMGKVAQMPLEPETYVQPLVLVRMAASIHDGLDKVERAKPLLQDYDLSTEDGKEQYYNLLRSAILSSNQCIDDAAVKQQAQEEGLEVVDEFAQ